MAEKKETNRGNWTHASNAAADELCPGRHMAERDIPDKRTSDNVHGDVIHNALKLQDPTGLTIEQADIYEACNNISNKQATDYFGVGEVSKARIFREERMWANYPAPEGYPLTHISHSGMADIVWIRNTKALIQDYKTLAGEVAASPENRQLRDLAVLLIGWIPVLEEIAVSPIQPLVTYTPVPTVYNREHLERAAGDLQARVMASNDPNAQRIPGPIQCKYCKAALNGMCLEYQRWAGAHVPQLYTVSNVPVKEWTPEMRADFCERKSIAQRWLDQTQEAMEEGLEKDPNFVPGWWMKPGKWRETVTDPQSLFDRFVAIGGKLEGFMGALSVGKEKFTEAVSQLKSLKGKKLEEAVKLLLDGLVSRKQDRPSLAKKPIEK
jgi:hypothetical protein